ncbi:ras GTPase-activating-like protein IQGAP1 isoform X3 [Lytechinus variegatus]|uniref:ras GTPase-activating-like protein IQGAP1 isoform X3 n=1 Tax=Lytechinus variegatus TaxID=7654 RepID=UPI001BB13D1D|nr:ras GTPase-activating-like protein IQGAP1 isoform X3 [Lytechinus variegatus]
MATVAHNGNGIATNGSVSSDDSPDGRVSNEYDHEAEDMPQRASADQMDAERLKSIAYQYLCHLEEAKKWMEACIREDLPPTTELEEGLRNGVYLGKLAHFFAPDKVPLKRIYDKDQSRFQAKGLHFRHTDNTVQWIRAMEVVGLPSIFYPETTDVYDRKNMPKTVYCLHALSLYLFKLGIAPQIQDLYGKVDFTEEEISAMQSELDKYGIQMPQFHKIGGILANELSVDDAAVHAAVIAINEAIDKQVPSDTMTALRNPNALMQNIDDNNQDAYQDCLYDAKLAKAQIALNKASLKSTIEAEEDMDAYDMLLTQAEIQGNLNKVNLNTQLDKVNDLLDTQNASELVEVLMNAGLGLKDVSRENADWYLKILQQAKQNKIEATGNPYPRLEKEEVQAGVNAANILAKEEKDVGFAIQNINSLIDNGTPEQLVAALSRPEAQLPHVHPYCHALYKTELARLKISNEGDLNLEQLQDAVRVLSAVAMINQSIDSGQSSKTAELLLQQDACLADVEQDSSYHQRYQDQLLAIKRAKAKEGEDFLTQEEIQEVVDAVNSEVQEEHQRIMAVAAINEAIDGGDSEQTLKALQMPVAKLREVEEPNTVLYQRVLHAEKERKGKTQGDDQAVLWLDEIQGGVDKANKQTIAANKLAVGIATINMLIDEGDGSTLVEALKSSDVGLRSVKPDCGDEYLQDLKECKNNKAQAGDGGDWTCHRTPEGDDFYFNLSTMESSWVQPPDYAPSNSQLSKEEIQEVVSRITEAKNRALLFEANEGNIVTLQAHARGMIARRKFQERRNYLHNQIPAIVRIQSFVKGWRQKRAYRDRLGYLKDQEPSVVTLQSYARMTSARKAYQNRLKYFRDNANAIIKLQAFWRSNRARHDYHILTHSDMPPVTVVRKFVHLLEQNEVDLSEELELQELRGKVVKQIRANQQAENDLNLMDIKIGLLVKNRITLQDVVSHGRKMKRSVQASQPQGLKTLSKEKRDMLEAYQHLFYLLQTNPTYLAKLIFAMPQSRTTKFMESVILTLYNYAANQREEYLLLKLFKTALEEEIRSLQSGINSKVDRMMEIVTGNPMVIRMVVTFNRGQKGQSSLRDILQPLVKGVMEDKNLNINTNPVEVYKQWINQMETQTGEASKLPYDVPSDQALKHKEVLERLDASVTQLGEVSKRFLNAIISSVEMIPYGIRYIAKVLRESLHAKFPDASDEEVLKIVGNLIYYRYMNPAIVAPDAFDIIDIGVDKMMTVEQRRNLGSITKVLQSIASGKQFLEENLHLTKLNDLVIKSFEKFKDFCRKVCDVPEPEVKFNINEYSDFVNPSKPIVFISVKEIIDTHAQLLENLEVLASDQNDPIHELLEDLGEVPSVEDILGDTPSDIPEQQIEALVQNMAKTEISLTLTNKFEIHEDDDSDKKRLFIKTKRLLVDIIRCQAGETIQQILQTEANEDQEEEHNRLIDQRMKRDAKASEESKMTRNTSQLEDSKLPLEAKKRKVERSLKILAEAELVSEKDNYQTMVNAIAQDIRNQRRYRQRRKQDIVKLRSTYNGLESKSTFYNEQSDYYAQYIKTCLDNLQAKRSSKAKAKDSKSALKYNAARLHEKGVILEIDGLEQSQFKNVMFEISATNVPGVFDVSAKFLGVKMDSVELVFQDLLQLQYEGAAVMNMFGRAKINVNLLIFLLNKKFYGK